MVLKMFSSRKIPRPDNNKNQKNILSLFLFSLLVFVLVETIPSERTNDLEEEMVRASEIMQVASDAISICREERGLPLDLERDINKTGLIGIEHSSITTTVGNLEAKRTTLNPNFAGLFVYLFRKAGVRAGDTIAAGASSSFPALIVALLSAAKTMNLKVMMICSLGASQWGANHPDFHWIDMLECLQREGVFSTQPIAYSLGGEKDAGKDMDPRGRHLIKERLLSLNIPFIQDEDLSQNVSQRTRLYDEQRGEKEIKIFVNIGGSWTNMGEDSSILDLKPGLTKVEIITAPEKRGVMQAMAAKNIPVIHCLYIKGLVQRYRMDWDPSPLPVPGEGGLYKLAREKGPFSFFAVCLYFVLVGVFFVACVKKTWF
jgi:poly-gamma-glutamate system protein